MLRPLSYLLIAALAFVGARAARRAATPERSAETAQPVLAAVALALPPASPLALPVSEEAHWAGSFGPAERAVVVTWLQAKRAQRSISVLASKWLRREFELDPRFVEALALTPTEVTEVTQTVNRARDQLLWVELNNATVRPAEDGRGWVMEIAPDPAAAALIHQDWTEDLARRFGADRWHFVASAFDPLEWDLATMGVRQRTITITPQSNEGRRTFRLEERSVLTSGRGASMIADGTAAELREHLGPLLLRLPPGWDG